ncbi:hypothetical protein [Streptomyces triticirhizae]|uniref:Secreted protein n=1 Tax=Streptomyces triticirhizae TaxID=2483353 RepID=A0A3M2LIB2_9ACTN|nr:hypothetical protein [Streptomyces triticirhizae]RMI37199.1 hypothetical protein EBN88_19630 [Streptomyces triticirhizae]
MKGLAHKGRARIATVSGIAALMCLGGTPVASAATEVEPAEVGTTNWTSSMSGVSVSFQSRRWDDVDYTEITWVGCDTTRTVPGEESSHLELRWDRSLLPDKGYGEKRAVKCFRGSGHANASVGEWTSPDAGSRFFQITRINESTYGQALSVDHVAVDTTRAD